jgi:putative hemolysin
VDIQTLLNVGLVVVFVLVGGVFAATEIALVSLRDSQLVQLERKSSRGARVASVARDPNRFLAAVQIGVTVAGFLSAAYGGATLAPDLAPSLVRLGLPDEAADTAALVAMTLVIAYLSLVLGELVPKRLALQRSAGFALVLAPPLDRFAKVVRPVVWLLSVSTDALVRLLGGDPDAATEVVSEEELRDIVATHDGLGEQERRILHKVFRASQTTIKEVMRPRGEVAFLDADLALPEAAAAVRKMPYSRYPVVTGTSLDQVVGFVHVRDLYNSDPGDHRRVRELSRKILMLPSTNKALPSVATMRQEGTHIAVVIDEYGGADGIVTLEDLVEELVGEIRDEYDAVDPHETSTGDRAAIDAGVSIEDFAEATGIELEDGNYETVAGYLIARLGRIPDVGDSVDLHGARLEVEQMSGTRITRINVLPHPEGPSSSTMDH